MEDINNIASLVSSHPDSVSLMLMIKAAGDAPLSTTMKMIEYLGRQYAKPNSKYPRYFAIYECPFCHKHFKAMVNNVNKGNTTSCGCYWEKRMREVHTTHGLSYFKDFKVWNNIKERTTNPNSPHYKIYGAKGIKMYDKWINDPEAFISYIWNLPHHREKEYSIDRIDYKGNYEPGNIRYATNHIQGTNKGMQSNNTSGYEGVVFSKNTINHWQVRINVMKKAIYLGCYPTPKEAAIARNNYIIENNLSEYKLNKI